MTKEYKKPEWAIDQTQRASGLIEDICVHGVGHPNKEWLKDHPKQYLLSIHGCDGCCSKTKSD